MNICKKYKSSQLTSIWDGGQRSCSPKDQILTYYVMDIYLFIYFNLEATTLVLNTDLHGRCAWPPTVDLCQQVTYASPASYLLYISSLLFSHGITQNQLNYATKAGQCFYWKIQLLCRPLHNNSRTSFSLHLPRNSIAKDYYTSTLCRHWLFQSSDHSLESFHLPLNVYNDFGNSLFYCFLPIPIWYYQCCSQDQIYTSIYLHEYHR